MAYQVSEVTGLIKRLLDREPLLQQVEVEGELSNFKRYPSGHAYFTLKDANSLLKCVLFKRRGAAAPLFEPANGNMVVVGGRIAVYERDGVYQLYADWLRERGMGDLMQAYENLKKKLSAEGLFEVARKRPLPPYPHAIGIVTSSAGAAIRDIMKVAGRRNPGVALYLVDVRVQGPQAPGEICAGIKRLQQFGGVDAIIVGRGGGSLEELWAFNDERVVRTIAASTIPIISAVGHETDVTLSDFAADVRAATPSQAAELAVPDRQALQERLFKARQRLDLSIQTRLEKAAWRVNHLLARPLFTRPEDLLRNYLQDFDRLQLRLQGGLPQSLERQRDKVGHLVARLDGLSPLAVLARGYSLTETAAGKLVRDVRQLTPGDTVRTRLANGSYQSTITAICEEGSGRG